MTRNEEFIRKAQALEPALIITTHRPEGFVPAALREGETLRLDFGGHFVGRLTLRLGCRGSHQDAPCWLRVSFAEREREFAEDPRAYRGWISKGWIQTEQLHADILPAELSLPRRYAFRYVQIEVLGASAKFTPVVEDAVCLAESSADDSALLPFTGTDPLLQRMDAVAVRTLHECMQKVFEDGPKRDRRLWLGDLRLQALANYRTYRDFDLVRRCLYLFAGCPLPDGRLAAAVFTQPEIEADDIAMFDYALLFVPALLDYLEASGDIDTARELWPTAVLQIEIAAQQFDEHDLVRDSDVIGWCFLDWNLALNKQAGAQGVYLYSLRAARRLALALGDEARAQAFAADYEKKKAAALTFLWDDRDGLFVSGADRQKSLASQVWMLLGGVLEGAEAKKLLGRFGEASLLPAVTPYMMHHYVEACFMCGEEDLGMKLLRDYWGGMVREGADTFWELYDPADPDASPYGGSIVNSYCHAWSCAPAYFLRKG